MKLKTRYLNIWVFYYYIQSLLKGRIKNIVI